MRPVVAVVAVALAGTVARGQSPESRPAFEAASIKPNPGSAGFQGGSCGGTDARPPGALAQMAGVRVTPPAPDTCQFTNITLQMLMSSAYGLGVQFATGSQPGALAGAPAWFNSAHFDILAKASKAGTNAQLTLMLQRMLEDRFALKFHRETREADGFALAVAPGGSKMTRGSGPAGRIGRFGGAPWTGTNVSMDELARFLAARLDKPVTDATGLAGGFSFTLIWTPGEGERSGFPRLPPGAAQGLLQQADPNGPSLTTALREQLGLRLEPRRVPTEVLIIDSARLPAEN